MIHQPNRRQFLAGTTAVAALATAALAATSFTKAANGADDQAKPKRRILAGGGGSFQSPDKERRMLRYIVALAGKPNPQVCYLPTAGGDQAQSIVNWYESMNDLSCRPRHLRLINNSTLLKNLEQQLLSMDAIYVGGGNTLNMLAIWKAQGIDKLLHKAWESGILLTGESAGMICWFEQGVSDSRPGPLSVVNGMGWLKGSASPHYHHKDRQPSTHRLLLSGDLMPGVACDDGTALYYEDDRLVKGVTDNPKAGAFHIRRDGDKVIEELIELELLEK